MGSISGNMCLYIPYSINIHSNAYYAWKVSDITGIIPYSMHNRCIPPTPARTAEKDSRRKERKARGREYRFPIRSRLKEKRCPNPAGRVVEYWVWGESLAYPLQSKTVDSPKKAGMAK